MPNIAVGLKPDLRTGQNHPLFILQLEPRTPMPRPAKHVFVCTQQQPPHHPRGSCVQQGCGEVFDAFLAELQGRNLFGSLQVTATGCLGPCTAGPSVLVYPEGVMYGGVRKADVAEILEQHLLGGEPVERLQASPELW